jgi:hypothetical protein
MMNVSKCILLVILSFVSISLYGQSEVYEVSAGSVHFHSDAPQELIRATSKSLIGAVDIASRTFLFKVSIATFVGFNSPLQKEHFNENYLESDVYPNASYSGRIIEEVDLTKDGDFYVRSKGKLTIHGVEQQRIIKCHIICKNHTIQVQSDFTVLLADHNIKIPRIVSDKLSPEINVAINATMVRKTPS